MKGFFGAWEREKRWKRGIKNINHFLPQEGWGVREVRNFILDVEGRKHLHAFCITYSDPFSFAATADSKVVLQIINFF